MEKRDGFLPIYWEASTGKLWMEIPRPGQELIYVVSLPAGVGSNDIGLDRGQLGGERIVRFDRVGPRVLMVQPNQGYRATTDNPAERRAVEESFAQSVLWGFTVAAADGDRVLVDATDFVLRDAHGVIPALRRGRQGDYKLDATRSALYLQNTKAFPRNTEIEATITFTGDNPGNFVRDVTPTPEAITVRQRHSFVALPPPGYTPRRSDPRSGFFGIQYYDFSTPVGGEIIQRFASRHRLEKRDPSAAMSDPVEPIVYYVDAGAPEPIRSALLDGARWWNQAFEAAGYRDAFRVEIMPDSIDPMDARYNVIQWVHRSTRGWSYGATVTDPRTGEIIKGHVTLGSLRVRQDYLLAEGLLAPYTDGTSIPPEMERMALARIRQLAAHEVGHTLGIAHNYVSSTQNRASVMDYPHPLVQLREDGSIDLSNAYTREIGDWDKLAITWGYADFADGTDEYAALNDILSRGRARGLTFLTDQDARSPGSAHPQAHLWDNGTDAAAELRRVMTVRRAALDRFGAAAIRYGRPMATLEEVLVPLYLHHRYQAEAAAKVVGGQEYAFTLRGDEQAPPRPVAGDVQRAALDALMTTLDPAQLALPRTILGLIPPRPFTYDAHREMFDRYTGMTFDAVSPAVTAADMTVSLLLNPERAARLVEQNALDRSLPGLEYTLDRLVDRTFGARYTDPYQAEIDRGVEYVVVRRLMQLAMDSDMPQVRALAQGTLMEIRSRFGLTSAAAPASPDAAFRALVAADITRFLDRPYEPEARAPDLTIPPGQPIGDEDW
ncbi:zinc-dependent metalloprotease [Longimicrobium sp.]|uniref:zinc-dependent metalloprotease n=1 Tax=Longimicrobium sp. TaxID=2029185 RepID=UPI002E330116|nr:zinc-dependent metalloprotease [Longimicrobium sp.]HEX6042467.1 zinc-dependent metalloprotease [Longimicrobium sp.]